MNQPTAKRSLPVSTAAVDAVARVVGRTKQDAREAIDAFLEIEGAEVEYQPRGTVNGEVRPRQARLVTSYRHTENADG